MNEQSFSEREWEALHEEIQKRLRDLAAEVGIVAPTAKPRFGKTVTKLFPLFSHVSFNLNRGGVSNDIIVGVDIGPEEEQWRIDADISDEEEGAIYFELPNTPFAVASFEELRDRVLRAVDELVNRGKPELLRLFAPSGPRLSSPAANSPDIAAQT